MSDPIERHSHISITRQTPVGIVHADMRITSVEISGMPGDMGDDLVGDCFDPDSCCDEHEKAMIAALRAYLRPEVAPECLLARLRDTLDRCCCEDGGNAAGAVDEPGRSAQPAQPVRGDAVVSGDAISAWAPVAKLGKQDKTGLHNKTE